MIATKKAKLIRKHLGDNTPEWVIKNCMALIKEYEEIEWCNSTQNQAAKPLEKVASDICHSISDSVYFFKVDNQFYETIKAQNYTDASSKLSNLFPEQQWEFLASV